jgi:anti-anti-sigma factor
MPEKALPAVSKLILGVQRCGKVVGLNVRGELDLLTVPELITGMIDAVDGQTEVLVLDLSGISFVDTCAARLLARACRAGDSDFRVVIRGLSQAELQALRIPGSALL